ncbi:MAG: DUF3846 domain-containing protein [Eubacteriales bacterium]|nr:DUF3846 domain-containing protein [Eubacteriales bacterium]
MLDVLLVQPNRIPKAVRIKHDLKTLQRMVGGTIAAIYPFEDAVALIVNDEGKLLGLPLNRSLRLPSGEIYDIIAGDFLVVGLGKEDFTSLSASLQKKYMEHFYYPEMFMIHENAIISFPMVADEGAK